MPSTQNDKPNQTNDVFNSVAGTSLHEKIRVFNVLSCALHLILKFIMRTTHSQKRLKYFIKLTINLHKFNTGIGQIAIPVSAVFTAVSMRPSRPPIAWKKNSDGVKPARYEFSTKPRDSGP